MHSYISIFLLSLIRHFVYFIDHKKMYLWFFYYFIFPRMLFALLLSTFICGLIVLMFKNDFRLQALCFQPAIMSSFCFTVYQHNTFTLNLLLVYLQYFSTLFSYYTFYINFIKYYF